MGPCGSILLKQLPDDAQRAALSRCIEDIGDIYTCDPSITSWDFWVRRGKVVHETEDYEACLFSLRLEKDTSFYEAAYTQMEQYTGYRPIAGIEISAGCKSNTDHLLLAGIAAALIRLCGGWIDFGGVLTLPEITGIIKGRVFAISYETDPGVQAYYHIGDGAFLESWMKYPGFHMIK